MCGSHAGSQASLLALQTEPCPHTLTLKLYEERQVILIPRVLLQGQIWKTRRLLLFLKSYLAKRVFGSERCSSIIPFILKMFGYNQKYFLSHWVKCINQSPINKLSCWQPESDCLWNNVRCCFRDSYELDSLDFVACCSCISLNRLCESFQLPAQLQILYQGGKFLLFTTRASEKDSFSQEAMFFLPIYCTFQGCLEI